MGETDPQRKTSVTFGLFTLPLPLFYHVSHRLLVRLYRPGFQLLEVTSENQGQPIIWQAAPDLQSQAEALDALFPGPFSELSRGSQSPAHREALLFGASEFDRLAAQAKDQERAEWWRERAKWLRERADE
jgi:hypothetical protein